MGTRGGAGRGQGRKRGYKSIAAEKAREFMAKKIGEVWTPLLNAKIDLALGHKQIIISKITGQPIDAYMTAPDASSIQYLMNQQVGRPTEKVELSGRDGKPLIIRLDE